MIYIELLYIYKKIKGEDELIGDCRGDSKTSVYY